VREYFNQLYDEDLAFAMYLEYEEGDDSILNDLIIQLCPLIRKVSNLEIGSNHGNNLSIVEGEALVKIYELVASRSIPTTHPKVFSRYIFTSALRKMRDIFKELQPQVLDFRNGCARVPGCTIPGFGDKDNEIYEDQAHKVVREMVTGKIRFIGNERSACLDILDSVLGYSRTDPMIVKGRYKLCNKAARYFERYIRILVKAAFIEVDDRECRESTPPFEWTSGRDLLCTPG